MTKPTYCPGCGVPFRDTLQTRAVVELEAKDELSGEAYTVWDCYCSGCGWSGDICPDEEEE